LTNAAVGFDRERLAPTFALEYGVPGASSALTIAERFGVEASVIARAAALLPEGVRAQRALLHELEEQRERLARAAADVDAERQRAAELTRELEAERRRRLQDERGRLSLETQNVLDEVQRARARLRDAEARLGHAAGAASGLSEARRATNELARFVSIGGALRQTAAALEPAAAPAALPLSWDELAIGAPVALPGMGASGIVLAKPRRDQVTVAIGSIKTTVGIESLSASSGATGPGPARASSSARSSGRGRAARHEPEPEGKGPAGGEPMRTRQNTLVLVGARVDAALERLDAFIDGLMRENEPFGLVVHGHGTGALRSAVREHLARHPSVRRSGPAAREDGGDALTLFWIG
jgi:DNA mismatch repair protein MutS2